jgi:hypothetical protein
MDSPRSTDTPGFVASPKEERELLDAIAGIERGETVSAREVLERLRVVRADLEEH